MAEPGRSESKHRIMTRKRMGYVPPPHFHLEQILAWADAFNARTGIWPKLNSGRIAGASDDTWRRVDSALRLGLRGLPGGSSLAQLLAERRGARNDKALPRLTARQILAWADSHYRRTGAWPKETSGPVAEAPEENWFALDRALRAGVRGLPGGTSLAQLLARRRKVRNVQALPLLTEAQILAWADRHFQQTGDWPRVASGPVQGAAGETWAGVQAALSIGRRGLPGGSSVARLLAAQRGVRHTKEVPRLTRPLILAWAKAHRQRTGAWPGRESGPIPEALGETWAIVDAALKFGGRGLRGRTTLRRLLARRRRPAEGLL